MHIEDIEEYLEQHEQKELLRFVTVGSVDDGKSTLIGRLLHDTHGVYEDQLADARRATEKRAGGGDGIDLALVTDGLKAEREQGITIDVAYRYFSTAKRKFIIADTPGHVQYTRNMATGASTADVALILIDARLGVLQQSRRHGYIASLLGIPHLAVCVNKMDLRNYEQDVYDTICEDFAAFGNQLDFDDITFFPISAVAGDNVVHASDKTAWYGGLTLLDYLETVSIAGNVEQDEFRFPVQYVLRPDLDYRGFCGRIASGMVRKGDAITALPSGKSSTVAAIDVYEGELDEAFAPMSVTLRLSDEIDVSRGDMLVHTGRQPVSSVRFDAHLVWMSEEPLDKQRSYFLKHTTRLVRANVASVTGKMDLATLEQIDADTLELNDIGRVVLTSNQPIQLDPYRDNRSTGAFILIDSLSNNTVAAGMIVGAVEESVVDTRTTRSLITPRQRRAKYGQRGVAVWFDDDPGDGQAALAYELERVLFEQGRLATVIDVAALADGTRSAQLFADIALQCVEAGLITILSTGLPRVGDREELQSRLGEEQSLRITLRTEEAVQPGVRSVPAGALREQATALVSALEALAVFDSARA